MLSIVEIRFSLKYIKYIKIELISESVAFYPFEI